MPLVQRARPAAQRLVAAATMPPRFAVAVFAFAAAALHQSTNALVAVRAPVSVRRRSLLPLRAEDGDDLDAAFARRIRDADVRKMLGGDDEYELDLARMAEIGGETAGVAALAIAGAISFLVVGILFSGSKSPIKSEEPKVVVDDTAAVCISGSCARGIEQVPPSLASFVRARVQTRRFRRSARSSSRRKRTTRSPPRPLKRTPATAAAGGDGAAGRRTHPAGGSGPERADGRCACSRPRCQPHSPPTRAETRRRRA